MQSNYYGAHNDSLTFIRKLHNEKKMQILLSIQPLDATVLDLCCGRGGDIIKYKKAGVKEVLMIDQDEISLDEGQQRAASIDADIFTFQKYNLAEKIHIFRTKNNQRFDIVIIHFAIHYFYTDYCALHNVIHTVLNSIKLGGHLVISMLSKERLSKHKYQYRLEENEQVLVDIFPVGKVTMEDYNQVNKQLICFSS